MKRSIILFGAFLSTFILILVPSIGSVNANIQKENNLNFKYFDIEVIKTIKNRLLNNDCDCLKTTDNDNNKFWPPEILCFTIAMIAFCFYALAIFLWDFYIFEYSFEICIIAMYGVLQIGVWLGCDFDHFFPDSSTNIEEILQNFIILTGVIINE